MTELTLTGEPYRVSPTSILQASSEMRFFPSDHVPYNTTQLIPRVEITA